MPPPSTRKVGDDAAAPPAARPRPSPPPSETARGGRIWRVAAAIASGFFHGGSPTATTTKAGSPSPSAAGDDDAADAASAAFFAADAADYPEFVDELVDLIVNFTPHDDKPALLRLLRLLDTRLGTLVVAGRGRRDAGGGGGRGFRRFADFSPREREAALLRWMKGRSPLSRAARGLKSLVFLALFRFVERERSPPRGRKETPPTTTTTAAATASPTASLPPPTPTNPFWEACSYSSPSLPSCSSSPARSPALEGGARAVAPAGSGNGKRPSLSSSSSSLPPSSPSSTSTSSASHSVSPDKVATEATLLARTVDVSRLSGEEQAVARLSALGFAPTEAGEERSGGGGRKGSGLPVVTLEADAVVVGSGAGGGVAAAVLSASGLRVVVLEKGRYHATSAVSSRAKNESGDKSAGGDSEPLDLSERAFSSTMERGTLCSSRDLSATALAGSTLGGGTRINWCASFPTPTHVRREWSDGHGLPVADGDGGRKFEDALSAVCHRMRVGFGSSPHNGPNSRLAEGLVALGVHAGRVPRNCRLSSSPSSPPTAATSASADCGRCCFSGCPTGHKQDHTHTFLADAARSGALILTGVSADRVLLEKKKDGKRGDDGDRRRRRLVASGVEATPLPAGSPLPFARNRRGEFPARSSPKMRLVVKAPVVVAAAGSLHTPALLLRSGLRNRNIGRGLRLHPSLVVFGRFEGGGKGGEATGGGTDIEDLGGTRERRGTVRANEGPIMSSFGKGLAGWDGEGSSGYGPLLMTPSLHLAGFAATVPWSGSEDFKRVLSGYGDWAPVLVLTRDGGGGGDKRKQKNKRKVGGGRVTLDSLGQPRFDYRPSREDAREMARGAAAAVGALAAAGASEVGTFLRMPRLSLPAATKAKDGDDARSRAVAAYQERIESFAESIRAGDGSATIISAHQMGTCRAGTSPRTSVVRAGGAARSSSSSSPGPASGETWEASNLFVCDASAFPTASGVNPMITVCALSWMFSMGIAERVAGKERAAAAARSILARAGGGGVGGGNGGGGGGPSSASLAASLLREAVEGGSGLAP